ncbi:MAG TPA: hypothetical protein ENJ82_00335 [Bacteroidetes bacterium]|nr:hypothetical protein [Bacteroidota bacterium]
MGFPEDFRAIVVNYLKQQGDFLRLSSPNTFGIPLKVEGSSIEQVIYTASFMNCYMVYMGKIYQQIHQHTQNPFHPDSKVITMVSFGIDCSIPYILGLSWAIESGSFKPVDYLLPNYFCNLEAAKFSTSRKHAIWAADIVEKTAVSSDTVRFYLARINPQHGITNFDIQDFFELNNDFFAGHLQNILTNSWEEVVEGKMFIPDNLLVEELEDLLIAQGNALCPPHFEMAQSLEPLERWIGQHAVYGSGKDAYWWLKGFALLAWPIMPACAQSLWKLLGMEGEPLEEQYFLSGQVEKRKAAPLWFPAVTQVELSGILPEHMKPRMK